MNSMFWKRNKDTHTKARLNYISSNRDKKEELYKKITNKNSSAYLTLMSIVQGVALSYFASHMDRSYQSFTFADYLLSISVFMILILTWFEYYMGGTMFIWVHRLMDSIIPFTLFVAEILLIRELGSNNSNWFYVMAFFCFGSIIAFKNMYHQAIVIKENKYMIDWLDKHLKIPFIYLVISFVLFIGFGSFWSPDHHLLLSIITFFFVIGFGVRAVIYWEHVIRYTKS